MDITVEDGLIHVSADCAIAPGQGQPRVLVSPVSYENPQEGLRGPLLGLTFDLGAGIVPPEYEATHRGDVDDIDQIEQATTAPYSPTHPRPDAVPGATAARICSGSTPPGTW